MCVSFPLYPKHKQLIENDPLLAEIILLPSAYFVGFSHGSQSCFHDLSYK